MCVRSRHGASHTSLTLSGVDHLLAAASAGRVGMLHDVGYPYLFHASGADIKANFTRTDNAVVSDLGDETWYLVETWDQSKVTVFPIDLTRWRVYSPDVKHLSAPLGTRPPRWDGGRRPVD